MASNDVPGEMPNLALFAPTAANSVPDAMVVGHSVVSSCTQRPLVWHTGLPEVYQRRVEATGQKPMIMCNVCNERLQFPAYHCAVCQFDCHLRCVATTTDPELLKARNIADEGPLVSGAITGANVLDIAKQYPHDEMVQTNCMRAFIFILQLCLKNEGDAIFREIQFTFATRGDLEQVMQAMALHPHSDLLQGGGCAFFAALVRKRHDAEDPLRNSLGSTGVFDLIARAIARFPDHDLLLETAWNAIGCLMTGSKVNKERVGAAGLCELLAASLRTYAQPGMATAGGLMEEICWVASTLLGSPHAGANCAPESNRTRLVALGVVPFLRTAAIYPSQAVNHKEVRKWATNALESLQEAVPVAEDECCVVA